MTLYVQNDAGNIANANSYVSMNEFIAYYEKFNIEIDDVAEDENLESALIRATQYIDTRFKFIGLRLNGRNQTTQWPRSDVYDDECIEVVGIPIELKNSTLEYAYRAIVKSLAPDPTRDASGRAVESVTKKVGPIETSTKYKVDDYSSVDKWPSYPLADSMIEKFVEKSNVHFLMRG